MKKLFLIFAIFFMLTGIAWAEEFGLQEGDVTYHTDNSVNWTINGDGNIITNIDAGGDANAIIGGVGLDDEEAPPVDSDFVATPQITCIYNGDSWISALEFPNTSQYQKLGELTVGGMVYPVHLPSRATMTISASDPRLGLPEKAKPPVKFSLDVTDVPMIRTQVLSRK